MNRPFEPTKKGSISGGFFLDDPLSSRPLGQSSSAPGTESIAPSTLLKSQGETNWARIAERLVDSLKNNPGQILKLNRSRKLMILGHLAKLSQSPPPTCDQTADRMLEEWIQGPPRVSPKQTQALHQYLWEIALIYLGKALVLKSWADRGLIQLQWKDFQDLHDAFSKVLTPLIPYDREAWNATRPSLYSWFRGDPGLHRPLFELLQSFSLRECDATWLWDTLKQGVPTDHPLQSNFPSRYELRSLTQIFSGAGRRPPTRAQHFGLEPQGYAFTPTLRSGAIVAGTVHRGWRWLGTESSRFQLILSELTLLWERPISPIPFQEGFGISALSRTQRSFPVLGGKQSHLSLIQESDACDFAWVDEREIAKWGPRSSEAIQFKQELSETEALARVRDPSATLGQYQAVVALSKLRNQGLLSWIRNGKLTAREGGTLLKTCLELGKLVAWIDLKPIRDILPRAMKNSIPETWTLWIRETALEVRKTHHPVEVRIYPAEDIDPSAPDAFQQYEALWNDWVQWMEITLRSGVSSPLQGSRIRLRKRTSPYCQADWESHWPESLEDQTPRRVEALQGASAPMGESVRVSGPKGSGGKDSTYESEASQLLPFSSQEHGFWVIPKTSPEGPCLRTLPLEESSPPGAFKIITPFESWNTPLRYYFESEWVREYGGYYWPQRAGKWTLTDRDLKQVPLLRGLHEGLTFHAQTALPKEAFDQSEAWVATGSKRVPSDITDPTRLNDWYQALAQDLESIQMTLSATEGLWKSDGTLSLERLVSILPPKEKIQLERHPSIRVQGRLPDATGVVRLTFQKSQTGSLVASFGAENGMTTNIQIFESTLRPYIQECFEAIRELRLTPTWLEVRNTLFLPLRTEFSEGLGKELIRSVLSDRQRCDAIREHLGLILDAWVGLSTR